MDINTIKENIVKGVRAHGSQCLDMGYKPDSTEVMQVALQILYAFSAADLSADDARAFVKKCGFSDAEANHIVCEDEYGTYAIY